MSFVERFIILCSYLGESTIGASNVSHTIYMYRGDLSSCKILWMLKIWTIHGKKIVVCTGRLVVMLTFMSKYLVVLFPTTKHHNFFISKTHQSGTSE